MEEQYGITGIILAGGQSKRMGTEKGLIPIRGKPLISFALETLSGVCDQIIISANRKEYKSFGFPVIQDEIKGVGPVGGILACLKASKTNRNFILSCDMPLINENFINWLIENTANADVIIPFHNGYPEPLCGIYSKTVITDFEKMVATGTYSLQNLLKTQTTKYLDARHAAEAYYPHLFENINTPQDVTRISDLMS